MKIKYLVAVVLMVISISACSNQRKLEKSAYNYPNSSITGTTVQLIAQNVAKYDLTIDDSISIYVSFKGVNNFISTPFTGNAKPFNQNTTPLRYDRKGRITINNVPPGDHNFIIHTTDNYPVKRINDTIHFSTTEIQANQLVKTKKYKVSTGAKFTMGIFALSAVASLAFVLAFASLGTY
jgi:hypothetical protein